MRSLSWPFRGTRAFAAAGVFLLLSGPTRAFSSPVVSSPLSPPVSPPTLAERLASAPDPAKPASPARRSVAPEVLRSLALPGWGAWNAGHRDVGMGFLALEGAIWSTVAVSIGQGRLRRGSSEDTALLFAGINLDSHADRFRKYVSNFRSSEEYNRLVVAREAASLYYGDFEKYNQYIDEHSLQGADAWSWQSDEEWSRYRQLRRSSERAFQRARFAAGAAVVNRVAAAIVSARLSRKSPSTSAVSSTTDALALSHVEWSVEPGTGLGLVHRLAWVLHF
jgi:hypothetical protein